MAISGSVDFYNQAAKQKRSTANTLFDLKENRNGIVDNVIKNKLEFSTEFVQSGLKFG